MMKNTPIILTLLCTSLVWCSAPSAMEHLPLVLDSKVGEDGQRKVLVLTPSGLEKAKSLEEFHNQQRERESAVLLESIKSAEKEEYERDLNHALTLSLSSEEAELEKAIRLSKEDNDPWFKLALSRSIQVHEEEQNKIAKEIREGEEKKQAEERRQAEKRRSEARSELEEVGQIRYAQRQSLFSIIDELSAKRDIFREERNTFIGDSKSTQEKEENLKLREENINKLSDTINSLYREINAFYALDNQIHEEIIHLIKGGDPRDLPWKQEVFRIYQNGDSSLPSSSLPSIPSSALPNLNSNARKDVGSGGTPF